MVGIPESLRDNVFYASAFARIVLAENAAEFVLPFLRIAH
jgi:hypothetical protein